MLADYSSIFNEKKILLSQIFSEMQKEQSSSVNILKPTSNLLDDKILDINIREKSSIIETNSIESELPEAEGSILRRQVMCLHYLFEANRDERTEIPSRSDEARMIHAILGKKEGKVIGGTNIYKYLEKPLTDDEPTNIRNLQYVRSIFEKLIIPKAVELVNKQIRI